MVSVVNLFMFFISLSCAEFGLTPQLQKEQRLAVLKVLGLGSSSKNLSAPKGLGTEQGLEVSIANEFINTESISQYLDGDSSKNTLYYPKIYIGKGISNHADLFIHFIPYTATLGLSEFGGTLKIHLLNAHSSPFSLSTVFGLNSANFNNELATRALNADISLGAQWSSFAIFTSLGVAEAKGKFIGGSLGSTDTLVDETEQTSHFHFSVGGMIRYDIYFASVALDRYLESVYSVKVGCHF